LCFVKNILTPAAKPHFSQLPLLAGAAALFPGVIKSFRSSFQVANLWVNRENDWFQKTGADYE
jgi:hypothetical protein